MQKNLSITEQGTYRLIATFYGRSAKRQAIRASKRSEGITTVLPINKGWTVVEFTA